MNEINQIANKGVVLNVRGHQVEVHEITMKNFTAFSQACRPFMHYFDEAGDLALREGKKPSEFALFNALADHSEGFKTAITLVSNVEESFLEDLRPDEFFEIASKVVEVNGSFFIKALAPVLLKFAQVVNQLGSMLSNNLSAQDTTESKS